LKKFCKKKKQTDEVFESITPTTLNTHLKSFMPGLSAKVFRTYNASKTLQSELAKKEELASWNRLTVPEKVAEYNAANREVAILCNHQRSVSKAQETQLENIQGKIDTLKKQKKTLKGILKALNSGKDTKKIPLKKDQKKMAEDVQKALDKAKKMKNKAKTNEEKIAATQADEAAKKKKRELADIKFTQAHLWEKTPSTDQVVKRIQNWTGKITKMEMDLKHKDDNKEVSLGTSKVRCCYFCIFVGQCSSRCGLF
jgi:DNA topoisomerase-1